MKRLNKLTIISDVILTCIFLTSCAASTQYQHAEGGQVIEMKTYKVQAPAGEDWGVRVDKEKDSVTFLTPKPGVGDQLFGMSGGLAIFIDAGKAFRDFSSDDEAGNYIISAEENDLIERGVKRGEFSLDEVKKGTSTVGSKKLYWMSYRRRETREDMVYENLFYIYIPSGFSENHLYYNLGIMKAHKRAVTGPESELTGPDTALFYRVIESFEIITRN